jgi:hypothetical protein
LISQHHTNVPIVALDLIVIGLDQTDLTNARYPFHAVLDGPDPKDEPIARLDHDPHPEDESPHRDMPPDVQAGLHRLPCVQPLHNIVKFNIEDMTIIHLTKPTHMPANLQPATWEYHPQQSFHTTDTASNYYHYDQHTTNKWKSWGQWKDYSKSSNTSNTSGWIDYTKPISDHNQYNSSTKPLTAYSSDHNNPPRRPPHRSGSLQPRGFTNVPPGRVAINLQDGSRDEWARHISYAMNHPERMRAANEIPAADRPKPS